MICRSIYGFLCFFSLLRLREVQDQKGFMGKLYLEKVETKRNPILIQGEETKTVRYNTQEEIRERHKGLVRDIWWWFKGRRLWEIG